MPFLIIYLCTDRHTGKNLVEWMNQIWKTNDICVRCIFLLFCLLPGSVIVSGFHCFVFQRLDIHAVTHDHGSDITKGVRLSGTHSFLCVDHDLDLTLQAGIKSASFAHCLQQSSTHRLIVAELQNLCRKLQ